MATIINNPPAENANTTGNSNSGSGFLVGVILLIIAAIVFFYYGLPYLNAGMGAATPQVTVPDQVDVNVNQQP